MRIAYVSSDFDAPIHGETDAAIHIRGLSQALESLGHEVFIFSPRRGGEPPPDFDIEVIELGLQSPEKRVYDLLVDDPAGQAVAREVRAWLYTATLRYRLQGVLSVFSPDAIYERYSLLGSGGEAIARALEIPLIMEVNGTAARDRDASAATFGQTARALERAVLSQADRVVALSPKVVTWLEELGVAWERIAVLPNAVEGDRSVTGASMPAIERTWDELARTVVGLVEVSRRPSRERMANGAGRGR